MANPDIEDNGVERDLSISDITAELEPLATDHGQGGVILAEARSGAPVLNLEDDTREWQPMRTCPSERGAVIEAWHRLYRCVVTLRRYEPNEVFEALGLEVDWIDKTGSNSWPTSAFSHWRECSEGPEDE